MPEVNTLGDHFPGRTGKKAVRVFNALVDCPGEIDKTLGALNDTFEPMAKSQRLPLLDAELLVFLKAA
jgi:hypothetical protein